MRAKEVMILKKEKTTKIPENESPQSQTKRSRLSAHEQENVD